MLPIQSPSKPTTAARVAVPNLSPASWRELLDRLEAQHPADVARIRRGADVLTRQTIREASECGSYLVQSSSDPRHYHLATSWRCSCPDSTQRDVRCKHVWAVVLLITAYAVARRERLDRQAMLARALSGAGAVA